MKKILLSEMSIEELADILSQTIFEKILPLVKDRDINDYLTREETAEILKVSLPTLRRYSVNGRIKSYRIGSRILYRRSDLPQSLKKVETL